VRVAFCVQRYGLEVNGGAELLCRQVAERMAAHWDVEVLTTCAMDYTSWKDCYAPGSDTVSGLPVRRFRVDFPRCTPVFNRLCETVFPGDAGPELEARWAYEQGPYSSDYLRYLSTHGQSYDLIIFSTYLYATTYYGLPRVAERSVLVPNAHDEPAFGLSIYRELFAAARGLIFNTPEEQQMVLEAQALETPNWVVGVGVEPEYDGQPGRFDGPYLLYLGRIDESKGCAELFDHFIAYRAAHPHPPLRLLLAGKSVMPIPSHPDIVQLGFIDEQAKFDALRGAELLVVPSPYESLSIVALESWTQGTPVLANGACKVLAGQCERSGAGLCYTDQSSFIQTLFGLLNDTHKRETLGESGKAFVAQRYSWSAVEQVYLECAATLSTS